MTNLEAADLLDNLIGMVSDNHDSDYDEALSKGRDILKSDPSEDCISRQAVLKAIDVKAWEFCDYLIRNGRNDEQKPVSHFADNLREYVGEDLPPVTPQPCEDAISRQAAIRWVKTECNPYGKPTLDFESGKKVIEHLKQMPPVTPQPKTGHWIEIAQYSDGKHKIECSECKGHIFSRGHANSFIVKNEYKYCLHCRKRMVEPQESEGKE